MLGRRFLAALLCLLLPIAPADAQPVQRHMVAAANPLAVDAGLQILRRGGSALDAAIAVQMVLGVVEPQSSGIGGGGFLLHYAAAERRLLVYDGRETAPLSATPELFLAADGKPLSMPEAAIGGAAVGVPGLLRMLALAHAAHGKIAWRELFAPAIELAEAGFDVPPRLARALAQEPALQRDPAARAVFYTASGAPRRAGERISNPALAATMRLIAVQGAEVLYAGPIAREMVRAVATAGRPGALQLADLARYRAIVRRPLCGEYRHWQVCGVPPPSSGALAILQSLGMLERLQLAREVPGSLRSAHLIAEVSRLAFADRGRWVGDPDFLEVPVEALLDRSYIGRRAALVEEARAMPRAEPGAPFGGLNYLPDPSDSEIPATSHMVIVDAAGNVVSFTTTIESSFGSRLFVRGFLLNNELTDFSFVPQQDGRLLANRLEPGKRPRSSMSPTMVFEREGAFVMALGSAGGSRIIGDVLHATIGVLDWGLGMQEAISLPRVLSRNEGTEIEAEASLDGLVEPLQAMGHKVERWRHQGGLAGIARRNGVLEGGADPRRDGVARGD